MDQPTEKKTFPFSLTISDDRLSAFLSGSQESSGVTSTELRTYLGEQGIRPEFFDESRIAAFLAEGWTDKQPWLVALGKSAKAGRDAEISYTFEKDPLKIGTLREGGGIDFKDRGEIPQVKAGVLLAKKSPAGKGESGVDIFGKVIPARDGNDLVLRPGGGTQKSADGLSFFSKIAGRPELLPDGTLCVFPELHIDGDVSLETGHVRFDGFIDVKGAIQEGFQVRGGRLAANEIYKAEVDVEGDIVVDGGIIGAKVQCRGNLKARYIQSSQIEVLGDVIVEGEIIHSKIETNGSLLANRETGKIFSSRIYARKGVEANQIGSPTSSTCFLAIGINSATQRQVQRMVKEIETHEGEKRKIGTQLEGLRQKSIHLAKEVGNLAQIQERGIREQRSLKAKMEEARKIQDPLQVARAEEEIHRLETQNRAWDKPIEDLMDQQEKITEVSGILQHKMEEVDGSILQLRREITETLAVPKSESDFPKVKVHHVLYMGTNLDGFYSSIQVKENFRRVEVQEKKNRKEGADDLPSQWAMKFASLPS